MNGIDDLKNGIINGVKARMQMCAERMAEDMRKSLDAGGHIDTGNLINSIHTSGETNDAEISVYVDIDAVSENGTWYAEFLEFGTGIYNERGNGRQTPWKYKDRHGVWHTTQGMQADPFIRPAVAAHIGELEEGVQEEMSLERYKR